jgi:hypothetical protein
MEGWASISGEEAVLGIESFTLPCVELTTELESELELDPSGLGLEPALLALELVLEPDELDSSSRLDSASELELESELSSCARFRSAYAPIGLATGKLEPVMGAAELEELAMGAA